MTYKLNKETCLWLYAIVISIVAICYWNKAEELWYEKSACDQKIWTLMVANERLENMSAKNSATREANRNHYQTQIEKLKEEIIDLKHEAIKRRNMGSLYYQR